jgi:hypothetical protein
MRNNRANFFEAFNALAARTLCGLIVNALAPHPKSMVRLPPSHPTVSDAVGTAVDDRSERLTPHRAVHQPRAARPSARKIPRVIRQRY